MSKVSTESERELVRVSIAAAREAQAAWAVQPTFTRQRFFRHLRHLIAEHATELASSAGAVGQRPLAEKLASEVLPLADACRWLERSTSRILALRVSGKRGRPAWLGGTSFEVQRQPFGTILIIGPVNYPLFLPAVQALHALAAGNAVLLKPAPGAHHVALLFADLTRSAGLPPDLLTILPFAVEAAREVISQGVDKVIFTGSSENGREVLKQLAASNTPSIMELSGEDAVLVLPDADLELVIRALQFGLRWNGGETCIAPHRILVVESLAETLQARLAEAQIEGLLISRVSDESAAVDCANAARFALGVSIFSRDLPRARSLASQIKSGFVLINDLIVPTADPRMPFGGIKASGFGVTRGEEGLLEMTYPHVVAVRQGRWRPHFDELTENAAELFSSYILATHGRGQHRLSGVRKLVRGTIKTSRSKKTE